MARELKWGIIGSGGVARRRTIPEGIVPAGNSKLAAFFDTVAAKMQLLKIKGVVNQPISS